MSAGGLAVREGVGVTVINGFVYVFVIDTDGTSTSLGMTATGTGTISARPRRFRSSGDSASRSTARRPPPSPLGWQWTNEGGPFESAIAAATFIERHSGNAWYDNLADIKKVLADPSSGGGPDDHAPLSSSAGAAKAATDAINGIGAKAYENDYPYIFVRGTNGHLQVHAWDQTGGWSWTDLGPPGEAGPA